MILSALPSNHAQTHTQTRTHTHTHTHTHSDGVGRSGAFLCIHSQLERLKTEGEVDVFKYLKSARTKRIGLLSEMVIIRIFHNDIWL